MRLPLAFAALLLALPLAAQQPDKYTWLEDVSSDRAMTWVKAENARSAAILEADPRFAAYQADALKIAEDPNRLPVPTLRGADVYNLWRDAQHTHGLLRKTTRADYQNPTPRWQTVIDFDALGQQEKVSWVSKGLSCLYPGDSLCLVAFSAGGEDAITLREFDLRTGHFIPGGFTSPHSKQGITWIDKDTLLVTRDWGAGTLTRSGYPFVTKRWKRGTPLDQATELFRGQESDIQAGAFTLHDPQGHALTLFDRTVTTFERQLFVATAQGLQRLALPEKVQPIGMIDGRVLFSIQEQWTTPNRKTPWIAGSLLEVKLTDLLADPTHLKPSIVFEPTQQEFYENADPTRGHLILTALNHVQGRAYVYTPTATGWSRKPLPVPANVSVSIISTSNTDDAFYLGITGFLTPSSLWSGDAATASLTLARSQPALFDAAKDTVEQLEATSRDGTRIPYFIVHAKDIKYDSTNPTLLNAYGGFELSMTPSYSGNIGKLWLEHGGVFVLANIRGGGEFGPAWHEAGLKTQRQRIYDDFASVAQDLIARKITSPRRLGIMGGSNGGLLMGVQMTQHPDLWNAIVIQVPLLDMLGYEHIAAGASWVGEYGSASVPAERSFLASISPYEQLKPNVKYPEPLIFTTTKDDRVGPQHARKFAAKMEEFHLPFLYDEVIEGGHGAGADLKEESHTWAETYVYLTRKLMD